MRRALLLPLFALGCAHHPFAAAELEDELARHRGRDYDELQASDALRSRIAVDPGASAIALDEILRTPHKDGIRIEAAHALRYCGRHAVAAAERHLLDGDPRVGHLALEAVLWTADANRCVAAVRTCLQADEPLLRQFVCASLARPGREALIKGCFAAMTRAMKAGPSPWMTASYFECARRSRDIECLIEVADLLDYWPTRVPSFESVHGILCRHGGELSLNGYLNFLHTWIRAERRAVRQAVWRFLWDRCGGGDGWPGELTEERAAGEESLLDWQERMTCWMRSNVSRLRW